jgi:hypothetical protein
LTNGANESNSSVPFNLFSTIRHDRGGHCAGETIAGFGVKIDGVFSIGADGDAPVAVVGDTGGIAGECQAQTHGQCGVHGIGSIRGDLCIAPKKAKGIAASNMVGRFKMGSLESERV